MASRRSQKQEEISFRVLRLLSDNPDMSTRKIADIVGISNGSTYYCINALIHKGMIKLGNFRSSKNLNFQNELQQHPSPNPSLRHRL